MQEKDHPTEHDERRVSPTRARAVVEDTDTPGPGQMCKTPFLDAVETVVRRAVDTELAAIGTSSASCPYLQASMARYRATSAGHVERTARRYAGAGSGGPGDLVAAIAARAARASRDWARDGSLTGVAAELGLTGTEDGPVQGFGGTGDEDPDPGWVLARLGRGAPLSDGQRRPMETAFGESFAGVEFHDGSAAREVTTRLGVVGLAVGAHVAMDPTRVPDGPVGGSAVLAHELAHVVQHRRGAGGTQGGADLESRADLAVGEAARVLAGERPPGAARRGIGAGRGLQLQGCDGCGRSPNPPTLDALFSEVAIAVRAAPDTAAREAALSPGIAATKKRADTLRSTAGHGSGPIMELRRRIMDETGVGTSASHHEQLDANPFYRVGGHLIEHAYRAWAENPTASLPPWTLLAIWVKEGANQSEIDEVVEARSAADARAIWRSIYYFRRMGADHYVEYTAVEGEDNLVFAGPGTGAGHDRAFRSAIADQVRAGRLPRDVSAEIDAELSVVAVGPDQFRVRPTDRFYVLSLMLTDAYWRENREAVEASPVVPAGTSEADLDQLTYMGWNMGPTRLAEMFGRDMTANPDPDGSIPDLPTWAFHREVVPREWGQPRANAIRFHLAAETYRLAFEGW